MSTDTQHYIHHQVALHRLEVFYRFCFCCWNRPHWSVAVTWQDITLYCNMLSTQCWWYAVRVAYRLMLLQLDTRCRCCEKTINASSCFADDSLLYAFEISHTRYILTCGSVRQAISIQSTNKFFSLNLLIYFTNLFIQLLLADNKQLSKLVLINCHLNPQNVTGYRGWSWEVWKYPPHRSFCCHFSSSRN